MRITMSLLAAAALPQLAAAAPEEYEVKSLPGWDGPLLSKAYCGFTDAGTPPNGEGTMHFNYVFIESENDPANDPVIVWYNGGPGADSMFGMFVELGPYYLNQDSLDDPKYNETGIPQVQHNPYGWTKVANVIAVNNPPPIGYSYCDGGKGPNTGPEGDGYSCGDWNDSLVAKANHQFLTSFFTNDFPEFAKNDLYILGESYAGIYVPTIVREILADPGPLNLRGFGVGDGCMGTDVLCGGGDPDKGPYYDVEFFHGHGQVCAPKRRHGIATHCANFDALCRCVVRAVHLTAGVGAKLRRDRGSMPEGSPPFRRRHERGVQSSRQPDARQPRVSCRYTRPRFLHCIRRC